MARQSVATLRALLKGASGRNLTAMLRVLENDERPGVRSAVAEAHRRLERESAEASRLRQLYRREDLLRSEGRTMIAGVDEVGRGSLAGPLSAGACILPAQPHITGLDDSKRLTPGRRRELSHIIKETAVAWSVSHVDAPTIDRLGMARALRVAMREAIDGLLEPPDHVVIDGLPMGITSHETAVVKGDSLVAAIAAASIIAKVERDDLMCRLAQEAPHYGFEINKGYGTAEHLEALDRHGRSRFHRVSFCPGKGMERLF